MPDTKITALTALTAADPANDVLPIVDVSDTTMAASGTTKKISINNVLGASGTATLASATITGDLTVDTSTLKVDSANNRVGVNTASPATDLEVRANGNAEGTIRLYSAIDGSTASPKGSYFSFRSGSGSGTETARLSSLNRFANVLGGDFSISTADTSSVMQNRLTIDSGGVFTFAVGGSTAMTLNANGLGVGVVPSAGKGALQLSSGINFPATQVASTDANTLDDYEEGTFTPTIVGTTGAGTGTYTTQLGRYTKVGRIVTCDISLVWTAHDGTGNIDVGGLPFSVLNTTGYAASAVIGYIDNIALTAGNIPIAVLWWFNTTKIRLNQTPTGGGAAAGVPMDSAGQINLSITYIVA